MAMAPTSTIRWRRSPLGQKTPQISATQPQNSVKMTKSAGEPIGRVDYVLASMAENIPGEPLQYGGISEDGITQDAVLVLEPAAFQWSLPRRRDVCLYFPQYDSCSQLRRFLPNSFYIWTRA